jgi:hypothetical protein
MFRLFRTFQLKDGIPQVLNRMAPPVGLETYNPAVNSRMLRPLLIDSNGLYSRS